MVICHLLIAIHINHIKLTHSELHGLPDGQNSHRIGGLRTGFKHCGEQQKVLPSTSSLTLILSPMIVCMKIFIFTISKQKCPLHRGARFSARKNCSAKQLWLHFFWRIILYQKASAKKSFLHGLSFLHHRQHHLHQHRQEQAAHDKSFEVAFLGDHGWQLGEHGEYAKWNNFEISNRFVMSYIIGILMLVMRRWRLRQLLWYFKHIEVDFHE